MHTKLSGWVRQTRHRATRHGCHNNLTSAEVVSIFEFYKDKCAYCSVKNAIGAEHPFHLNDVAPNVAANVLPSCQKCRTKKKDLDLLGMFSAQLITESHLLQLLRDMLSRPGGDELRAYLRRVTAIGLDSIR